MTDPSIDLGGIQMYHPSNADDPSGTYKENGLDIAVWDAKKQEWFLKNYAITSLDEGRAHLARLRDQWASSGGSVKFKLVHLYRTVTIDALED
jgi:hypothetical protein